MNRASTGDPIPDAQLSTDVLIVGGGPIGLALALHLDMYGVRSTIFNAEPEARWHPKGNIHNARTMELFRKVGIADRIRALGTVEIYREFITAAARWIFAAKLWSVLSARMAMRLNSLSLQKKFSIR